MLNPEITQEFENEILTLIENQDQYTQSDLQGIVSVLVNKIMQKGYEALSSKKK
jgi:hypothetical protein